MSCKWVGNIQVGLTMWAHWNKKSHFFLQLRSKTKTFSIDRRWIYMLRCEVKCSLQDSQDKMCCKLSFVEVVLTVIDRWSEIITVMQATECSLKMYGIMQSVWWCDNGWNNTQHIWHCNNWFTILVYNFVCKYILSLCSERCMPIK